MTQEEAVDIIREAGFGYLATVQGQQPRVRPMMPYLTEDNELLLALLPRSRTIDQIGANSHVEICFVDRKMWYCRVAGTAVMTDDVSKKETVWQNIPMLRQYFSGPQDENFKLAVVSIKEVEAMTPHQKEPEHITL